MKNLYIMTNGIYPSFSSQHYRCSRSRVIKERNIDAYLGR